jgi:hypothetical protein
LVLESGGREMNKIILFLTLGSISLAASKDVQLDIAKIEYGARSETKQVVDNDIKTFEKIDRFVVRFATETKIDKIDLKINPARGKLTFKTIQNGKEKFLNEIETSDKDGYVYFTLKTEEEYDDIIVEWVPNEEGKKLEVKEFGAYTSDKDMITLFNQIKTFLAKNATPEAKISNEAAGSETLTTTERNMIVPVKLPTEYTISPARIYN